MKLIKLFKVFFTTLLLLSTIHSCKNHSTVDKSHNEKYYKDTSYIFGTNQLRTDKIPDSVFQMINLKHLVISGMDCSVGRIYLDENGNSIDTCYTLKEIPDEIRRLTSLTSLALGENDIEYIPKELTELKNLKVLNLQDNPIHSINYVENIETLEELYLHGCPIAKLPENIGNLKKLRKLGLNRTNLNKAEELRIKKVLPNCRIQFPR